MHMMSEIEITKKLLALGCKQSQVPKVIGEVQMLINGRALEEYLKSFPAEERARILALQPEDLQAYLDEKKDTLPQFRQEQFDAIYDQTWHEYFTAVK
jgi:hypothetical protein